MYAAGNIAGEPVGYYRGLMSSPAAFMPDAAPPPPAAPRANRSCITPTLAAEFDRDWEIVLDRVKQSKDRTDLHNLLNK